MRPITLLILVSIVPLSACTSMQEVRANDERPLADLLQTGDRIIVYERTGRIVDMRYVLIDGETLRGSLATDGLEVVEVNLADIERIESERLAVGRTTGAVLGGIVVLPIAALGAGLALSSY